MRDDEQLARLLGWASLNELFSHLRRDRIINNGADEGASIRNDWFPTPDAETYAAMINDVRPELILEIGGGFSTLVARATLDFLGLTGTELAVIDPSPRTDVRAAADTVTYGRVEDVGPDQLPLARPVLLFIDSSHVTRTGGDVPYLFTRVIPSLLPGSVVHVHDVSIPFDYPPRYQARFYTEQYVLQALLIGSERFRVLFASAYMGDEHPQAMRVAFGETVPAQQGGASFWFQVVSP